MNRTSVAAALFITVLAIVQTSVADEVSCMIECLPFEHRECHANGGEYVPRGGFCGCNACVKYVGRGYSCGTFLRPPLPTQTCKKNLICVDGFCRPPIGVPPPLCPGGCTEDINPVCVSEGHVVLPFNNRCLYHNYLRCGAKNPEEWKIVDKFHCSRNSTLPKTDYSEQDCPGVCVANYSPVCGSDGETTVEFANTCLYESHVRCQVNNSNEWNIVTRSSCQKTKPTGHKKDPERHHEDLSCPGFCSLDLDPICGSDGNTTLVFANKCQYDFHLRCQVNNSKEWNLISNKNCPELKRFETEVDRVAEACPGFCTLEYNPVCGSDGKFSIAFANQCQYEYYLRCQVNNSRDWKVVPMSVCQGPATTNTSGNDSAESCPGMCTFDYYTVCGSDGNTTMEFANRCQYDEYLRCEVKNPKEWKLVADSACLKPATADDSKKNSSVESSSASCPGICSLGYAPVCGSDGKTSMTFNNKCQYDDHVRCVAVNKNEWKLLSNYSCQKPDSEDGIKYPNEEQPTKESCPGRCTLEYKPICASDGKVSVGFGNKCQYDFHLLCKVNNSNDWKIVPNLDCLKPETNEPKKNNSTVESCPGRCTSEITPVCGSGDGMSIIFGNQCQYDDHLRCQAENPQNWKILPKSACIRVKSTDAQKLNSSPPHKIQRHRSNNRVR